MSVVYQILNTITGHKYIGSTKEPEYLRFSSHRSLLNKNKHYIKNLQKDWNKHGEMVSRLSSKPGLLFEVIEYCEDHEARKREQYYLTKLNPEYNTLKICYREKKIK